MKCRGVVDLDSATMSAEIRAVEARVAERWRGASDAKPVDVLRELISKDRAKPGAHLAVKYSVDDVQLQMLFVALCRRYGLSGFRRPGQRKTTFMAEGPERFMSEVWPPLFAGCASALRARVSTWMVAVIADLDKDGIVVQRD